MEEDLSLEEEALLDGQFGELLAQDENKFNIDYDVPVPELEYEDVKRHIETCESEWSNIYEDIKISLLACYSDKPEDIWTNEALTGREGKPVATIPLIRKYVKKITSYLAANKISIKVTPRIDDPDVSKDAITFVENYIRGLQDKSGADKAYLQAYESAIACGLGFLFVKDKDGQRTIESIKDVTRCYIDHKSDSINGEDARFGFIKGDDKKYLYFEKVENEAGEEVCVYAKIDGDEIEEQGACWTDDLPIIPVYGDFTKVDGEKIVHGIVSGLINVQQGVNWAASKAIEQVSTTPQVRVFAEQGSIVSPEVWNRAITEPVAACEYTTLTEDPNVRLNAPQIISPNADLTSSSVLSQYFGTQFSEITGLYNSHFGDGTGKESGIAIELKQEASYGIYESYLDNLKESMKQCGKVLLDYARKALMENDAVYILNQNGQWQTTRVDMLIPFDSFDFAIDISKSYNTKKNEAVEKLVKLAQVIPNQIGYVADLIVGEFLPENQQKAADRIYNSLLKQEIITPDVENNEMISVNVAQQMMNKANMALSKKDEQIAQLQVKLDAALREQAAKTDAMLLKAQIDNEMKLELENKKQENENQRHIMTIIAEKESNAEKLQGDLEKIAAKAAVDNDNADKESLRDLGKQVAENKIRGRRIEDKRHEN
jgi:hypothetical protein